LEVTQVCHYTLSKDMRLTQYWEDLVTRALVTTEISTLDLLLLRSAESVNLVEDLVENSVM
jgi:hypothetical protein